MTSYRSLLWPNLQFSSHLTTKELSPDHLNCTIGSALVELVGLKLYFTANGPVEGEIFRKQFSEHQ